jgi:hypothetical protein
VAVPPKASGMEAGVKNLTVQLASHGKGSTERKQTPLASPEREIWVGAE